MPVCFVSVTLTLSADTITAVLGACRLEKLLLPTYGQQQQQQPPQPQWWCYGQISQPAMLFNRSINPSQCTQWFAKMVLPLLWPLITNPQNLTSRRTICKCAPKMNKCINCFILLLHRIHSRGVAYEQAIKREKDRNVHNSKYNNTQNTLWKTL